MKRREIDTAIIPTPSLWFQTLRLTTLAQAHLDPLPESERLSLWINAYNAHTIELINRRGERKSIRNINKTLGLFGGKGPWKERLAEVAGSVWTLDEIEQEIIRKRFSEPRIHFALVCAAIGCPPLRNEAYVGERLDRQLGDQARAFLAESPAKNRIDTAEGVAYLSPIFDWYREDFPAGTAGLGGFIARFHPSGPVKELLQSGRFRVEFTDYDWSLNWSGKPTATLLSKRSWPRSQGNPGSQGTIFLHDVFY